MSFQWEIVIYLTLTYFLGGLFCVLLEGEATFWGRLKWFIAWPLCLWEKRRQTDTYSKNADGSTPAHG